MHMGMMGMGLGFFMVPLMSILIFGFVFVFLFQAFKRARFNDHQPRLTVNARVVSKRTGQRYNNDQHTTNTQYYVTFEVESGDRMELCVYGKDYGMLIEGDHGKLFFQGDRYLGFERE